MGCKDQDVYLLSLELYKQHLKDLESKDINMLKKQMADMRQMKVDLEREMEEASLHEASLLQQREDLWDQVDPRIVELRKNCLLYIQELEEVKQDYDNLEGRDDITATEETEEEEQGQTPSQSVVNT